MIETWSQWLTWTKLKQPGKELQKQKAQLFAIFKELKDLDGVPQDPGYHPEGDVWTHTCLVCDAAAMIAERESLNENERLTLVLAALCHDLGKAKSTFYDRGRWRSPKHDQLGARIAAIFLEKINCPPDLALEICALVREHIFFAGLTVVSQRVARRLLIRLAPASFDCLMLLIEADMGGRDPRAPAMPVILGAVRQHVEDIQRMQEDKLVRS